MGCSTGRGARGQSGSGEKAAHPNSRLLTAPMRNNPALSTERRPSAGRAYLGDHFWRTPAASTVPLVFESFDWTHGVI